MFSDILSIIVLRQKHLPTAVHPALCGFQTHWSLLVEIGLPLPVLGVLD